MAVLMSLAVCVNTASILVACALFGRIDNFVIPASSYRAAVYEHAVVIKMSPVTSRQQAMEHMMQNLNVYKKQAEIAMSKDVDIIVFPEDGIYDMARTRTNIKYYLEYMPDPKTTPWVPCDDPYRYNQVDVQVFLSCLAKNNSLYLVANFGDVQQCEHGDPNCPDDGQYQYNTDVVYDRNGTFIAKYHKQNLFHENQFDSPTHPEHVYFDTEFGRFGVFTCFDILFHDPAVPLVEMYNITDVAFPTAWMDALPFFSAIGYHSSFAVAHNVNFLAANIHLPSYRFQGSGIYTPTGANAFYYDRQSSNGKLLISDVTVGPNVKPKQLTPPANRNTQMGQDVFKSVTFNDWYNYVALDNNTGSLQVCQAGFCCFLEYDKIQAEEKFAFGVFNGMHVVDGQYYLQVCILVRCLSADPQTCGQVNFNSSTTFNSFRITGNFTAAYVLPQVIQSEDGVLKLPDKGSWTYTAQGLQGSSLTRPLLSAALVGRVFESDG